MLAERAATWPKQWMAEGYAKGYALGLREALAAQVEEKFGSVDSRYVELIADASEEKLRIWLRGVLRAASASELFRA